MPKLTVLEFVRHADQVWNMPREALADVEREFPEVRFESPRTADEADRLLPEADAVLGWAVRPDNFESARRLKWVQVTAAGVGGLLFPALVESPVIVTNGRGIHAQSMAEHTLGVILSFARRLHLSRDAQRERRWSQQQLWATHGFDQVAGTRLGLVGLGAVGGAIARGARALGVEVVAVRKHPDSSESDSQWGVDRLEELIRSSDWLVLAAPLTSETRGLIGARELSWMKPNAVLINLGRGPLVDEAALIRALRDGRIGGAGLDVFEREPPEAESPFWEMPNVILTAHVSGLGPRYWERSMDLFRRNLRAFLSGAPLENVVDKRAGY